MTKVIHIGDGRHIEIDEGAIFQPPQAPIKQTFYHKKSDVKRRDRNTVKKPKPHKDGTHIRGRMNSIVGYTEWWAYKNKIIAKYRENGRRLGEPRSISRDRMGYIMGWVKRRVKKDMEKIMEAYPETDEVAQEALKGALEVLRGPQSQGIKLQAAKLLLEFTKTKPVAKSEVSVNAAEAWLASLGKDE